METRAIGKKKYQDGEERTLAWGQPDVETIETTGSQESEPLVAGQKTRPSMEDLELRMERIEKLLMAIGQTGSSEPIGVQVTPKMAIGQAGSSGPIEAIDQARSSDSMGANEAMEMVTGQAGSSEPVKAMGQAGSSDRLETQIASTSIRADSEMSLPQPSRPEESHSLALNVPPQSNIMHLTTGQGQMGPWVAPQRIGGLPKYDGGPEVRHFLMIYEKRIQREGYGEHHMIKNLGECLKGVAEDWFDREISDPYGAGWKSIKEKMLRQFIEPGEEAARLVRLTHRRQGNKESLREFLGVMENLYYKAIPDGNQKNLIALVQEGLRKEFSAATGGLSEKAREEFGQFKDHMYSVEQNLRRANGKANEIDFGDKSSIKDSETEKRNRKAGGNRSFEDKKTDQATDQEKDKEDRLCFNCQKPGHIARNCKKPVKKEVKSVVKKVYSDEEVDSDERETAWLN